MCLEQQPALPEWRNFLGGFEQNHGGGKALNLHLWATCLEFGLEVVEY